MSLFLRNAELKIGTFDASGLRFAFTVDKHLRKEPNTAKISVWNLSETRRKALEDREDGVPVELSAGLGGESFLLFKGLLDVALSERDGSSWITNIYTDDGKDALKRRAAVSYRGGVNVSKLVQDLSKEIGVGVGNLLEVIKSKGSIAEIGSAIAGGFAAKGGPGDALFGVLNDLGIDASIQDGEIQAVAAGQPIDPVAVLLKPTTGLKGTPAVDRKGRLEASAALIPRLVPGAAVQVESLTANGLWRVDVVSYTGDTAGTDWTADIEGTPLQ